ncbi:hypothetical protein F4811DRAFT_552845 [Daldinia bambusicola]|nr:hypothetical protein F4811DRAFT_552845 [Daldinia bambusicola]
MAPTAKNLEKTLHNGVRTFVAERGWEQVTVNNIRQYVEDQEGLEQGFFKAPEWKARSKKIIEEFVAQLQAEEDEAPSSPAANVEPEAKNGIKRQSDDEPSPAPKRQKKVSRAVSSKKAKTKKEEEPESESESELSDLEDQSDFEEQLEKGAKKSAEKKDESDSELSELDSPEDEPEKVKPKKSASGRGSKKEETESELSDLEDSDEPKKSKATKKATSRRKTKEATKNGEAASDLEDSTTGKKRKRAAPKRKQVIKRTQAESDSEGGLSDSKDDVETVANEEAKPQRGINSKAESKEDSGEGAKPDIADDKDNGDTKESNANDSDSDLSSVVDDPPPKKRKPREPKGAAKPKQTKELSADETEIKKLQGQLVKCGVRKIWGIELKKYGDDSKAKIRHLKGMLRDIGMEGRFSEAKAKEIKERRELMADLEAVTEMNRNWGSGAGGRASRSKATKKTLKEESDDEDNTKDEEDEDEKEEAKGNSRVSKRMAALAFLGSDSESD